MQHRLASALWGLCARLNFVNFPVGYGQLSNFAGLAVFVGVSVGLEVAIDFAFAAFRSLCHQFGLLFPRYALTPQRLTRAPSTVKQLKTN